jgi:hypothetical protein
MEETGLINRVAQSGIITINLENYYPVNEFKSIDLKDFLWQGLILKEKEFRQTLKDTDWQQYKDNIVLIHCSTDAIIPLWAYMLMASALDGVATDCFCGSKEEYLKMHYRRVFDHMEVEQYKEQRIVIKGCGEKQIPPSVYADILSLLKSKAQSIMYGEPCSTVPVFKRPRVL